MAPAGKQQQGLAVCFHTGSHVFCCCLQPRKKIKPKSSNFEDPHKNTFEVRVGDLNETLEQSPISIAILIFFVIKNTLCNVIGEKLNENYILFNDEK